MVWRDNEVIFTRRTERQRANGSIYRNHVYKSIGGLPTCFLSFATAAAGAWYHHKIWTCSHFGLPTWGRMAILMVVGAQFGQFFGTFAWGNPSEYWNLKMNGSLYKKEMNEYKKAYYG
ncbi:unnamed protein product [Moneuplotes crassus]|uniref:Uncharacterized protein n=1 Tax=Euplotes crassus TaxID=5936 RepID=A0AAD1XZ24_EUPCR|nr:unnamed protein product [Moneuplotes crassus]